MTLPTPTIRERLVERIREILDPLLEGGCKRFVQEGQAVAEVLPCAILRCVRDRSILREAGGVAGGRRQKRMSCVVEVRCFHDKDNADPNTHVWSDQYADVQMAIVEDAIAGLELDAGWNAIATEPKVDDDTIAAELIPPREGDTGLLRAVVSFDVVYAHQHLRTTEAA